MKQPATEAELRTRYDDASRALSNQEAIIDAQGYQDVADAREQSLRRRAWAAERRYSMAA